MPWKHGKDWKQGKCLSSDRMLVSRMWGELLPLCHAYRWTRNCYTFHRCGCWSSADMPAMNAPDLYRTNFKWRCKWGLFSPDDGRNDSLLPGDPPSWFEKNVTGSHTLLRICPFSSECQAVAVDRWRTVHECHLHSRYSLTDELISPLVRHILHRYHIQTWLRRNRCQRTTRTRKAFVHTFQTFVFKSSTSGSMAYVLFSPNMSCHTSSIQRCEEQFPITSDLECLCPLIILIWHDQHFLLIFFPSERDIPQSSRHHTGSDSHRIRTNKFGGRRNNTIGWISRRPNLVAINRQCPWTLRASAGCVWLQLCISSQIPFQDCSSPVSRRVDNQVFHLPREIAFQASRCAHPLFREIDVLVGMCIVHLCQGFDVAASPSSNIVSG